jgi:16S rRNA processing protein RimM
LVEDQVALAAIAGAHGIRGEVRLKLFADGPDSLRRHKQFRAGDRLLTLVALTDARQPIARFAEIGDRTSAESVRGRLLTVPRSALPPLEPGEYYHADLIGLRCESEAGESFGTVVAVENFGAGDLLEVERTDGRRSLLPFRPGIADLADGRIVVDPDFLA